MFRDLAATYGWAPQTIGELTCWQLRMLLADPALPGEIATVDRETAARWAAERRTMELSRRGRSPRTPRECWQELYRRRRESLTYLAGLVATAAAQSHRSTSESGHSGSANGRSGSSELAGPRPDMAPSAGEPPSSASTPAGDATAWDRVGREVLRQLDERLQRLARRARLTTAHDPLAPPQFGVFGPP